MMRAALTVCLVVLPLSHAMAADHCLDASQIEMNVCAYQRYRKADTALNATYRALMARSLDPDVRGKLVSAQRAWVSFRDADCAFEASGVEGGSVQPMILNTCLEYVTSQRDKDLKAILTCEEGDLACPIPAK